MGTQISGNNVVAVRYASALIEMADDSKVLDKIEQDMADLDKMMESSADLSSVIRNPLISKQQKQAAIEAIASKAKFQDLTTKFLSVLAVNGRLQNVTMIMDAFKRQLRVHRGEIEIKVQTASALTAEQTKTLKKQFSDKIGMNVTLEVSVNKDIIGGMVVTIGSRMIDDSVRSKLERLGRSMGAGSNENTLLKEVG